MWGQPPSAVRPRRFPSRLPVNCDRNPGNHTSRERAPIALVRIRVNISRIAVIPPPRAIPIRWPIPKRIPARPPANAEAKSKSPPTPPAPSPAETTITPKTSTPTETAATAPSAPISGPAEATKSCTRVQRRNSAASSSERVPLPVGNGSTNVPSISAPAGPSATRTSTP
jgi:hypothetical protein